jgi:hypothetical protein
MELLVVSAYISHVGTFTKISNNSSKCIFLLYFSMVDIDG